MSPVTVLVAAIFMAAAATAMHYRTDAPCDFSGFNPNLAVSRLLSKLPKHISPRPQGLTTVFPGFEVGGLNASGFDLLDQYGPALPYCVNGSRSLQVELINVNDVVLSIPWRTCSGNEGTISFRTELFRFTLQLGLAETGFNDEVALSYRGPTLPVATENPYLVIEGAGDAVRTVAAVLSKIFSSAIREMWHEQFFYSFRVALKNALQ